MFWDYYRVKRRNELPLGLIIALIIIVFIAVLILTHYIANSCFINGTNMSTTSTEINNKLQNPGLLGDSAGIVNALFSALALGGVIYTVYLQRKEIDSSQKNGLIEKFETKFYEMIHLHKQNVDEIKVDQLVGRKALEKLFDNFAKIYKLVEFNITNVEQLLVIEKNFLTSQTTNITTNIQRIEIINQIENYLSDSANRKKITHEISYGYFFYGVENYHITKNRSDIRYHINLEVTTNAQTQITLHSLHLPTNSLLGHYFRHLYQTVQFVAQDKTIKNEEMKYNYIKLLRAQLSDFEQALLYYNSLSVMGKKWVEPLGENQIEKMCYIARFRLIKNIPYYYEYFGNKPANYFATEIEVWQQKGKAFFEIDLNT